MKSLLHLNKYFVKYRLRLVSGFIFVVIYAWFNVYSTPYVGKVVDYANDTYKNHPSRIPSAADHLLFYVAIFIGMAIIGGFFLFLTRQMIIVTSRLIEYDLKNEVFEHYQKLDTAFYKRNNTGDLMNRITEDVSRVRMYVGPAVMYTVNTITIVLVTLVKMLQVNTKFTLYVLSPMPVLYFVIYYIGIVINKKSTTVQQQLSILFNKAQETFSGIRVIKSYRLEKTLVKDYEKECEEYKATNMSLVKVDSFFQPALMVLIGLSAIIVVYIGGVEVMKGQISVGKIVDFMLYVTKLTMPIASFGWITSMVQRAAASQTRINEFLETEPTIKTMVKESVPIIAGSIEFSDVTFVYPDSGTKALDEVSFSIAAHESLGIVGRTGSGKSSIAQLLSRLYDPTSGSVKIDGRDIRQLSLSALRSHIGYVPQEVFLFSDSIANNISFSKSKNELDKDALRALVEKAAKDSAIYDNIMEFPEGFETMVGERGITLSGGQKQRVSIARAMLKAPGILVFDDCISAVDTKTEQEILQNIEKLMMGRTTLIISHRISSVKFCDKIIVLDKGKVVEHGTHEELISHKGLYREMHEMQLTEEQQPLSLS
ncbi:MAG TPA: ABC transporter ATP-binding protein [Bacteroidia bacterium]|nr:ABC transporter ATP-binding protein [Bacteroidia bacterium]